MQLEVLGSVDDDKVSKCTHAITAVLERRLALCWKPEGFNRQSCDKAGAHGISGLSNPTVKIIDRNQYLYTGCSYSGKVIFICHHNSLLGCWAFPGHLGTWSFPK